MKILMVCLGNICRSPLAEGILKHKAKAAGLNWTVESAGTYNFNRGQPPHQLSRKVARVNGINIDKNISRGFIQDDFECFDKIYGMSIDVIDEMKIIAGKNYNEKKVSLLMDELFPGQNVEIPDPLYGTESDFQNVFSMIDSACSKIIEKFAATVTNTLVYFFIHLNIRSENMTKTSLPQGTRDFAPDIVRKRNYIFNSIRNVFELYGFQPLETPAMEHLETLTGKYGEEGDKLIFKILNNGISDPKNIDKSKAAFEQILLGKNDKNLTERALRYDLTIPFARYVAMNFGQLNFPFKRYQIQPVWRADRPQKGRYREFYQCDADVVGSNSLINEVEFATIYHEVFSKLGLAVDIKINSRNILAALAELCGDANSMVNITTAIDKLDKIGLIKVKEELAAKQLTEPQISLIEMYLLIDGTNEEKIRDIKLLMDDNKTALKGIGEIEYILDNLPLSAIPHVSIDFTLARGLNYYTGIIFEVKARNVQMGSIGGGGRYDDLTGLFGVPGIPGAGISFGVDRIYDVMEELKLFPQNVHIGTRLLFFNLGETESRYAFVLIQQLRAKGVSCELYHEAAKFDKQFKYADRKNIPFTVIIGSKEIEDGTCVVKNLKTGEQETIGVDELMLRYEV